jgi:hypothetical protein
VSVSYVSRHQKYFFKNKKTPEPRSRPVGPRFKPAIVEPPYAAPLPRPGCVSPLSHPGRVAPPLLLGCATSSTPPSDKARIVAPPPCAAPEAIASRASGQHHTSVPPLRKRRGRELMGLEPHTCYLHVPPPCEPPLVGED